MKKYDALYIFVGAARERQLHRYEQYGIYTNSQLESSLLQKFCQVSSSGEALLRDAVSRLKLSPRAYTRLMKTARTIADIAGNEKITDDHLLEAISYREQEI